MSSDHYGPPRRDVSGYDPDEGTYHLHHDWTESTSLSYTLLTGVAAITGDEPHELDPLVDAIDPDALDELLGPRRAGAESAEVRLSLRFNGCLVTVHPDGHLVIEPPAE